MKFYLMIIKELAYDRYGHAAFEQGAGGAGAGGFGGFGFEDVDLGDILDHSLVAGEVVVKDKMDHVVVMIT